MRTSEHKTLETPTSCANFRGAAQKYSKSPEARSDA